MTKRLSLCAVAVGFVLACSSAPKTEPSAVTAVPSTPPITPDSLAAHACASSAKFTLVIHGGMGYVGSETQRQVLIKLANEGREQLKAGHSGVDVVQHVVEGLEDSGIFNAGRGGTRTNENTVELDASIMDGRDLKAGAVASVKDLKNPIRVARAVKDKTKHLLMVGEGASRFAEKSGYEKVAPTYFTSRVSAKKKSYFGTVGAVALDRCGHLAAATSTGGLYGKLPGRVGDSPIIGAGTYANDKTCAVSATGEGEKFIRAGVAGRISNILEYTKRDLKSASTEALKLVETLEGSGGLIAIDKNGKIVVATTTGAEMPAASVNEASADVWTSASFKK